MEVGSPNRDQICSKKAVKRIRFAKSPLVSKSQNFFSRRINKNKMPVKSSFIKKDKLSQNSYMNCEFMRTGTQSTQRVVRDQSEINYFNRINVMTPPLKFKKKFSQPRINTEESSN
jgi:hypothetical protein